MIEITMRKEPNNRITVGLTAFEAYKLFSGFKVGKQNAHQSYGDVRTAARLLKIKK